MALQQAARDVELLLKENITKLFDRILKKKVADSLSPKFLNELILKIVAQWPENKQANILLNGEDKEKLQKLLFSNLEDELKDSITLKVSNSVSQGFRIGLNGESAYYDFSDESITEALKLFLNPVLKELMDQKDG